MDQILQQIITELRSAWRFRWWGAALAWIAFIGGFVWVALQANVYEASARVYIDTSSVLRPILSNQIVPVDISTQLQYVRQALLGREQLELVVRETNLDVAADTPAARERILERLRSDIQLDSSSSGGGYNAPDNIYAIRYRNADRDTAVNIVSTLLTALVDDTRGANREGTATAERFLDERIHEYEQRLQRSEAALADFKRRNADRLPGAEGGYFMRIQQEATALDEARKTLRLAESRRDRLREQLQSETSIVPVRNGSELEPRPNSIDARIRDHRLRLDQLLLEYTERHPDVIAVREGLARLEAQRAEQLQALGLVDADQQVSSLGANPVYQAVRIAVNEAEGEIALLSADVSERSRRLSDLRALVNEVPEVEAELARLNRDYEIVYEQYQGLVRSRETQDLTRKAADADGVEFRVIEPPLAAFDPVAPDRLRLLAVVFLGSLAIGGGLCWLLAQLRPVFSSTASLRDVVGLPVLGAVSQAWTSWHRVRRRLALLSFVGVMSGLFALFLLGVAIEIAGPGLHTLTELI